MSDDGDMDMPMLGEEEEEEEEEDDLVGEEDENDEHDDDGGDDGDDGDMDLEDMLMGELDGDGGGDGEEEEEGEDEGEDGLGDLASPTTGGHTEPESIIYTEGDEVAGGDDDAEDDMNADADVDDAQLASPPTEVGDAPGAMRPASENDNDKSNDNDNDEEDANIDDDDDDVDDDNGQDDDEEEREDDLEEEPELPQEPVPDVHQQFAQLLADPGTPRLPSDPSIIDVSRLTIEQRKVYNAKVMSLLTENQLDRYECFRRSSLKEPMRRLVQVIVGGGIPKATDKIIVAMAGVGKVFVGELVEEARRIAEARGERGALQKSTVMEAYFRIRGEGSARQSEGRPKRRRIGRL